MASNDMTDPVAIEADQRAERAKASLRARLAVFERRLGDMRDRVDLPMQIQRHPWPAVGIAFALGMIAGSRGRPSVAGVSTERTLGRTALAGLAALGVRILRELVVAQVGRSARRWWVEQEASSHLHDDFDAPYGSQAAEP